MKHIARMLAVALAVLVVCALEIGGDTGRCQAQSSAVSPKWDSWLYHNKIIITEPNGLSVVDEPVSINLPDYYSNRPGEDARITDEEGNEIPYQLDWTFGRPYRLVFFAAIGPNCRRVYHLYYGNRYAYMPNYGMLNQKLDYTARTWKTDGLLLGWEATSSASPMGNITVTMLKLDVDGDGDPANDPNCLGDGASQDCGCRGYLSSSILGVYPQDFENGVNVIENGPLFCELHIGKARIRYYKGKGWIATNRYVNKAVCCNENYLAMKDGLGDEIRLPDASSAGSSDSVFSRGANTSPRYLAFRNTNNRLVFGAVATTSTAWSISAENTTPQPRTMLFDGNADGPTATVYWYADTSNGYNGIAQLATCMLNPLQVRVTADNTPPVTTMAISPDQPDLITGWYTRQPLALLSVNEPCTTYYRIDGGRDLVCSGPIMVPEGIHDFCYFSVDESDNKEDEKHILLYVDASAPEVGLHLTPANPGNSYALNQEVAFSFDATDKGSGIASVSGTLNGVPIQNGFRRSFNKIGRHIFGAAASDMVGHEISKTETFTVAYGFKWLSPVKRKGDPDGAPYRTDSQSAIPLRFTVANNLGKFVVDKSVKVVVADSQNSAVFCYGRSGHDIKANPCSKYYSLNIDPAGYPWLIAGRSYSMSVYFSGDGANSADICHGSGTLELR